LINFNHLWDNLDLLFGFMGIDPVHKKTFMRKRDRVNRMDSLSEHDKSRLISLYGSLEQTMNKLPGVMVI